MSEEEPPYCTTAHFSVTERQNCPDCIRRRGGGTVRRGRMSDELNRIGKLTQKLAGCIVLRGEAEDRVADLEIQLADKNARQDELEAQVAELVAENNELHQDVAAQVETEGKLQAQVAELTAILHDDGYDDAEIAERREALREAGQ